MGDLFSSDFREFLQALNEQEVEYILVGGFAVILHGYQRVTGDMDIWVNRTEENYIRIKAAFDQFGMSVFDMSRENFLFEKSMDVFRFGRRPNAIDIMLSVKGLQFSECFEIAKWFEYDGLQIKVLHINHLRQAKKEAGRFKDFDDLEHLPQS
jgi:predicted nucleotidyltransferase